MRRRILSSVLAGLAFALWIFGGCANPATKRARAIIAMPPQERGKALALLPAEEQLDVYFYAANKVEPPVILANELASNWRVTLPVVKRRLENGPDEKQGIQLLLILVAVSSSQCSLQRRRDVLDLVEPAIARMTPQTKELADRMMSAVTHPARELPFCE